MFSATVLLRNTPARAVLEDARTPRRSVWMDLGFIIETETGGGKTRTSPRSPEKNKTQLGQNSKNRGGTEGNTEGVKSGNAEKNNKNCKTRGKERNK